GSTAWRPGRGRGRPLSVWRSPGAKPTPARAGVPKARGGAVVEGPAGFGRRRGPASPRAGPPEPAARRALAEQHDDGDGARQGQDAERRALRRPAEREQDLDGAEHQRGDPDTGARGGEEE